MKYWLHFASYDHHHYRETCPLTSTRTAIYVELPAWRDQLEVTTREKRILTMDSETNVYLITIGELSDMAVDRFFQSEKLLNFLQDKEKKTSLESRQIEPKQRRFEERRPHEMVLCEKLGQDSGNWTKWKQSVMDEAKSNKHRYCLLCVYEAFE